MHAKVDELVIAMKDPGDEIAGIAELHERDIEELKEQGAAEVVAAGKAAGTSKDRAIAKKAAAVAAKTVVAKSVRSRPRSSTTR